MKKTIIMAAFSMLLAGRVGATEQVSLDICDDKYNYQYYVATPQEINTYVIENKCPNCLELFKPDKNDLLAELENKDLGNLNPTTISKKVDVKLDDIVPTETCKSGKCPIVLFSLDSASLTKTEKYHLDLFVRNLPKGATVALKGYTCPLGSYDYNMALSEKRAEKVANYLKSKGVNVEMVAWFGKNDLVSKDVLQLNRRVEVSTSCIEKKQISDKKAEVKADNSLKSSPQNLSATKSASKADEVNMGFKTEAPQKATDPKTTSNADNVITDVKTDAPQAKPKNAVTPGESQKK